LKGVAVKALLYLNEIQQLNDLSEQLGKAWAKNLSFCLLYVIRPSSEENHLSQAVAAAVTHLDQAQKQLIKQGCKVERAECTVGIPLEQMFKLAEDWSVQQVIIYRAHAGWPELINFHHQN
jgi:hypothetical protein